MALIAPTRSGLSRIWELASTSISSATTSDTAEWGLGNFLGTIYVITSGTVAMTIEIQESPDQTNWVTVDTQTISGNTSYRISHPFWWLRAEVTSYTSGSIDSIKLLGLIL